MDEWLNPPEGQSLNWPTDIELTDTHYLRMYIAYKFGDDVDAKLLPVMDNKQLVDFLLAKGYTFGQQIIGIIPGQQNDTSNVRN